jgi:Pyruvate/2-oxoacid:ferredoxin oxidoreductase gamma subunit
MTTRIALDGVGGQGVRVIAGVLGNLLARMGKEVTILFDYDSSVRGSMSDAFVIFDDVPIANPVVEEADILLRLADRGHLHISGRTVVTDLGLGVAGDEQIPFASLGSQHFGKELFGNMIALGRLLRLAEIDFDEAAIRDSLPRRYQDENVAAIHYGYELTPERIAELAAAAPPSRFEMNDAATAPHHRRTGIASGESLTGDSLSDDSLSDAVAAETG